LLILDDMDPAESNHATKKSGDLQGWEQP
jgi:hypothetical protein